MQYRLSTIFLIFFMVAASLALFGPGGLYVAAVLLIAALCLNRSKNLGDGIIRALFVIFIASICKGLLTPHYAYSPEAARRAQCMNNLRQIGNALRDFHKVNGHYPMANKVDQNGKPIFSWRVEILPMMTSEQPFNFYSNIYNSLKKDELWNSPHNAEVLKRVSSKVYKCPTASYKKINNFTNYVALIGPGTGWREDGAVKHSDLPDGGTHTVMVVEVVNSGVHWAEPRDLTVDEALEGMKTGKGLHISSKHPSVLNILFADGSVRSLPKFIDISIWSKILAGEAQDFDNIEENKDVSTSYIPNFEANDEPGNDLVADVLSGWPTYLSIVIWLFSIVLLFRRAIKSRKKLVEVEIIEEAIG